MPALLEMQQEMRNRLLAGVEAGVPSWILAPGSQATERLDVYRTTILGTLERALRLSFPTVHRLVGTEFFEGTARIFAGGHLPRRADLNRYGEDFPAFLQTFAPCAVLPYLPDVARLDWAAARALHAGDDAPVAIEALAGIGAADAASLCFTPHPALSLLRSDVPVDDIWRAVLAQDDDAMAAIDLASGPVHLVVERVADRVHVSRLSPDEWPASVALAQGLALQHVVDMCSADCDVPALLAMHLAAGRFVAFGFPNLSGETP